MMEPHEKHVGDALVHWLSCRFKGYLALLGWLFVIGLCQKILEIVIKVFFP